MLIPYGTSRSHATTPFMTLALLVVNVMVMIWFWTLPESAKEVVLYDMALIPEQFRLGSLITSMFMHGGFLHLLGNMWFLWIFGKAVEDGLSKVEYLCMYMAAGFVGASLHTLTAPVYQQDLPCVGASGSIAGVMGAFLVMYPKERIKGIVAIWPIQLPSSLYLAWYFMIQVFHGVIGLYDVTQFTGGIAFWAHIGGFIVGFVGIGVSRYRDNFIRMFKRQKSRSEGIDAVAAFREGRLQECKSLCQSILKRTPGSQLSRFLLARIASLQGDTQRALKILNVIRQETMSSRNYPAVLNLYAQMRELGASHLLTSQEHLKAGIALRESKRPREAITPLLSALQREDSEEFLDLILFQVAQCVSDAGDSRKAGEIQRRLVDLYPQSQAASMAKYVLKDTH